MDFPTAELLPVPRIFLATLLHFVWQATVVVALVAIARGLIQPRYCQVRYAISVVGIVVVLALPLMTFGYYTASPESLAFASPLALQDSMVQSGMVSGAMSEPGSLFAVCKSQFQTVFTWFDSCRSLWLGGWLLGFAVLVLRLSLSLGHCFRLRRDQTPLPAPLQRIADDLKLKLNLTQGIIVGVSTHITQAVATGVIKPIVLIPAAWVTQLPLTAIEAVLAHELAHVKRWDLWVNLIQRFTETVFFFHPLVWWLSQKISHEREICCDQLAVRVTGQPVHYVETLAHVAGNPCEGFEFQFGTAFTGGKNMNLLRRAKLILEPTSVNAQTPFRTLVLLACAGLLTTYGSYAYAATAAAAIQQDRDDHEDEHQDNDRRQGRKFIEHEKYQREQKARHFELRRLEGSEVRDSVRDDEEMRDLHLQWTDILRQNKSGDVSKRELAQQLREIADRLERQEDARRVGDRFTNERRRNVEEREGNERRYLEFPEIVVDLNDARERRMRPDDPRWRVEVRPEREDRPEARGYREGSRFSRDDNEYFDVEVHDELSEMEIEEEHGEEHEHRNRFMRRSDNEKLIELEFVEREEQDDIHEEHGHERRSVEEDLGQVVRELMGEVRELRREVERLQSDRRPTEVREHIEIDRNVEMDRRIHAEREMEQDRKNAHEHRIQLERELRPDRIRESRRDKASTEGFPGYRVRRAGDRDELKVDEDEFGRFTIDQLRFNIERSGNQAEEGFDSRHEDDEHGDHEHEGESEHEEDGEGRDGDQEVIEIEISESVLNVIEVKNNKKK